jgi:hypothetical protein
MTELRIVNDPSLSIARGLVPGQRSVNKFGRAPDCDTGVANDIWDRAAQPIWLAPTAARIHAIVSTSLADSDVGGVNPQGAGARTLRVYGLQTWSSVETFEDIVLDGTTAVNTANSYVIIHRMQVLTTGAGSPAGSPNTGTITATAAVDGTVTAQITPGEGQTQMAIYGVPSTQKAYLTNIKGSIEQGTGSVVQVDMRLLWCFDVVNQPAVFQTKHTFGFVPGPPFFQPFDPPNEFEGPGILKLQATCDTNNNIVDGHFDVVVVDD